VELLEDRMLLSTVTNLSDDPFQVGSLRYVLNHASAGDTIQFAVNGVITLNAQNGPLVVDKNVLIAGPGGGNVVLDGGGSVGILLILGSVQVDVFGLTFSNGAAPTGGAILGDNGDPATSISFVACVFQHNQSLFGGNGGVLEASGPNIAGTYNFTNCLFDSNVASGKGGAIDSPGINLNIVGCTFENNQSSGDGGAMSIGSTGFESLVNCTVSGNTSQGGSGGAIASVYGAAFQMLSCTFSGNGAVYGGAIANFGQMALQNTVVAGNSAFFGPDIEGFADSLGHNLIGNTSDLFLNGVPGNGDILGQPAGLGPLQNNGGPTPTMALLPGCPALDAGDPALSWMTDQRGASRSVNGVDIGAYQHLPASSFLISAPNSVASGQPFSVTVTALDALGGVAYTAPFVQLTSDDPLAPYLGSHTFTPGDLGRFTFTGVALQTVGFRTLLAADGPKASAFGTAPVLVYSTSTPPPPRVPDPVISTITTTDVRPDDSRVQELIALLAAAGTTVPFAPQDTHPPTFDTDTVLTLDSRAASSAALSTRRLHQSISGSSDEDMDSDNHFYPPGDSVPDEWAAEALDLYRWDAMPSAEHVREVAVARQCDNRADRVFQMADASSWEEEYGMVGDGEDA
jgi:predicted outer membrane repeat protein